jgi:hypothetical protein
MRIRKGVGVKSFFVTLLYLGAFFIEFWGHEVKLQEEFVVFQKENLHGIAKTMNESRYLCAMDMILSLTMSNCSSRDDSASMLDY